jgi:phospholipid N-methyltransferase
MEAQAPQIITVDAATECHVTPRDVAERMVDYLGPVGDYMTLEPSAGTGQLIRALLASGHSRCELCAVERHTGLFNTLHKIDGISGAGLVNRCFLEWTEEAKCSVTFPRIIMNPPFRKVRHHMAAVLSMLCRGAHDRATLVALVPVTYQHPDAEEIETLPSDTFASAKVFTKIVRIEK